MLSSYYSQHVTVCVSYAHRRPFAPQPLLDELVHEVGEVGVGASYVGGDRPSLLDHLLFVNYRQRQDTVRHTHTHRHTHKDVDADRWHEDTQHGNEDTEQILDASLYPYISTKQISTSATASVTSESSPDVCVYCWGGSEGVVVALVLARDWGC